MASKLSEKLVTPNSLAFSYVILTPDDNLTQDVLLFIYFNKSGVLSLYKPNTFCLIPICCATYGLKLSPIISLGITLCV